MLLRKIQNIFTSSPNKDFRHEYALGDGQVKPYLKKKLLFISVKYATTSKAIELTKIMNCLVYYTGYYE